MEPESLKLAHGLRSLDMFVEVNDLLALILADPGKLFCSWIATRLRSLSRRSAKFRPGLPMACRSFNMSFRFCETMFHTAVVERGNDDYQRILIVQFQTLVCYHDPMTDDFILDKVSITKLNKSVESVDMALTLTAIELGPFVHSRFDSSALQV
ncbi:uncharacterized protein K444DRAFT_399505 [Hyaloscypha bicolor E]|uniref:Uncharacterized protein n=1 Tax=Hyaloscypha bicolor E TaxID=1095630 RepID=A0A2J6TB38_9HELO|nr:uncharacterized protein K444DRAFT_399505 [Hyaloscypha bicolor E]PMD60239.1 hypothetical protein K444DRAFT_399505 [Hyaloscypha bicolor E]